MSTRQVQLFEVSAEAWADFLTRPGVSAYATERDGGSAMAHVFRGVEIAKVVYGEPKRYLVATTWDLDSLVDGGDVFVGDPPRWLAKVTYRTDTGLREDVHRFEEIEELQEIVEAGPSWLAIDNIQVLLAAGDGKFTVEDALRS